MFNVILDRDGTLNKLVGNDDELRSPRHQSEFVLVEDFSAAIQVLSKITPFAAVISNQPDVSRNLVKESTIKVFERILMQASQNYLRFFSYCFHDNQDGCNCRKPKVSLFQRSLVYFASRNYPFLVIGDSWIDILFARNIGATSILIEQEHSWRETSQGSPPFDLSPDYRTTSLLDASKVVASLS